MLDPKRQKVFDGLLRGIGLIVHGPAGRVHRRIRCNPGNQMGEQVREGADGLAGRDGIRLGWVAGALQGGDLGGPRGAGHLLGVGQRVDRLGELGALDHLPVLGDGIEHVLPSLFRFRPVVAIGKLGREGVLQAPCGLRAAAAGGEQGMRRGVFSCRQEVHPLPEQRAAGVEVEHRAVFHLVLGQQLIQLLEIEVRPVPMAGFLFERVARKEAGQQRHRHLGGMWMGSDCPARSSDVAWVARRSLEFSAK